MSIRGDPFDFEWLAPAGKEEIGKPEEKNTDDPDTSSGKANLTTETKFLSVLQSVRNCSEEGRIVCPEGKIVVRSLMPQPPKKRAAAQLERSAAALVVFRIRRFRRGVWYGQSGDPGFPTGSV